MATKPSIFFISGGVRSGKSSFAEKLAVELAMEHGIKENESSILPLHYVAAGQASDVEMKARIAKHRNDRFKSGYEWKTWEQPVDIKKLSSSLSQKDIVLLDCLTTLLNNELFQEEEGWKLPFFQNNVMNAIMDGVKGIAANCHTFLIVSNEVFYDPWDDNMLTLTYKRMLGKLHQQVVSLAEKAYMVEAGIPLLMKGVDNIERNHDPRNLI
jgi:adenosylcobinamide kinase / adenosylcobinamide-phosphate guanylyltransferase